MPVFGVGKVHRIWTPKGGPPQYDAVASHCVTFAHSQIFLLVLCSGSASFCVSGLLFLVTKRKSGWSFAGRLADLRVGCFRCDLPKIGSFLVRVPMAFFSAYAHV